MPATQARHSETLYGSHLQKFPIEFYHVDFTYLDENTFEQLMCSLMSQRALYSLLREWDNST